MLWTTIEWLISHAGLRGTVVGVVAIAAGAGLVLGLIASLFVDWG